MQLKPEYQRIIDERVRSGRYESAERVMEAALGALEIQECFGNFPPGELERLLAEGAAEVDRGELLDPQDVWDELEAMSQARREEANK